MYLDHLILNFLGSCNMMTAWWYARLYWRRS